MGDIDWDIVKTIIRCIQLFTSSYLLGGALLTENDTIKIKDNIGFNLFLIILCLTPIISQIILVLFTYETLTERRKKIETLPPPIPKNLLQICHMVLKNKDFTLRNESVYNNALQLVIGYTGISYKGKWYTTEEFKDQVHKHLTEMGYSDILEIYRSKVKVTSNGT